MSRIIGNPNGGIVRPGDGAAIDAAKGTKLPNAGGQPPRTVNLAPRSGQPNAPMRPRSPLPFHANPHHVPATRLRGEMRAQPAHVNQPQWQQEAERFQRAQLVHSALPKGGAAMKRLKERAARERPTTRAERWRAGVNGPPKPMNGKRREAFEALVRTDVVALAKTGKMEFGFAAGVMRAAVMEGTLGQGIREEDRQLLLAVLSEMNTGPQPAMPAKRPPTGVVHPVPARPTWAAHPTPAGAVYPIPWPPTGAAHPTPARPPTTVVYHTPTRPAGAMHPTPWPPTGAVHPTPARPPTGTVYPTPARPPMGTVHPTPWPPTWASSLRPAMPATTVPTLPAHIDRLYKQLKLKVTPDTLPAFTNAQVLEKAKPLGSGAFNTVFAVKLRNPDGSAFDGVFKPLGTTERGWVAAATGIPTNNPQIAMRNIATVSYAKKLGLDVVPDTRVALIDTGNGIVDPDLGLIMERARGKPAAQTDASILARPDVCAEVTKLQLLDHLTGQGDRHSNNYFINIEPNGRAKVMGIDNDQCFGKNLIDPAGIQQLPNDRLRYGFRGTGLPPVVDTEMAHAINALTPADIRSMLGDKLSKDEIQAAMARHHGVKNHIAQLRAAGRVIEPAQWGQANVQQLLNAQNSYLGRERAKALARENAPAANNNW